MSNLPSLPAFLWDPSTGHFDFQEEVPVRTMASRLGLIGGYDDHSVVFDSEGRLWKFRLEGSVERPSVLSRILAQFYNPSREVAVAWTLQRNYVFEELQAAYIRAVEMDDDILTQFVEFDELFERVEKCESFSDIVATWQWASQ